MSLPTIVPLGKYGYALCGLLSLALSLVDRCRGARARPVPMGHWLRRREVRSEFSIRRSGWPAHRGWRERPLAAPAVASLPGAPGAWLALLPPGLGAHAHPKWTVSRVLFRPSVARKPARIIHLGGALLRRSSALTRTLVAASCDAVASGGPPSTASLFELAPGGACPAAGHPAVARGLLPHDFNLACAST